MTSQTPLFNDNASDVAISSLSNRLRTYLKSRGISAVEASRRCGKSRSWIATMRQGTSMDNVKKFCEVFNDVNFDWLMYGKGEMLKFTMVDILKNENTVSAPMQASVSSASTTAAGDSYIAILRRQNLQLQNALNAANENISKLVDVNNEQNLRYMTLLEKQLLK
jgi:transcriptional regulator with XRE-family HTH domain